MKKVLLLIPVIILALALWQCGNKTTKYVGSRTFPNYEPFPSGYGYMDTAQLEKDYKAVNIPAIREHGWKLFVGIMQPAKNTDWPVWFTWPTSIDAFELDSVQHQLGALRNGHTNIASLIKINRSLSNSPNVNIPNTPNYNIADAVKKMYPRSVVNGNIVPGHHFISNGDIMIATESLSLEGYNWIRDFHLYTDTALNKLYKEKKNVVLPARYIVTKHMFWPVKANTLCALPVWDTAYFAENDTNYEGYETWKRFVAIDPTNSSKQDSADVTYLYHVTVSTSDSTRLGPFTKRAKVYPINQFYYHKVTQQEWNALDSNDQATIMAASYWAYDKPFEPGDYLVTIAMHINTKEIPTWALQSAWWTDRPNEGQYSKNRPNINVAGPWQHYDLVDAYGIPVTNGELPVATNPYIELVIHPRQTNCNNCHIRSGFPSAVAGGMDSASYQNPDCRDLLKKLEFGQGCLSKYISTDFQWIIPDRVNTVH